MPATTKTFPEAAPHRSNLLPVLAGTTALVAILVAATPAPAQSPSGGKVASGEAKIVRKGATTTIRQKSGRAVIDWKGFDVGKGNKVRFDQPGRNSATLNRVNSATHSTISGSISAPGTVVIQNTAGVIFTGSAKVDTGGLVATSQRVGAGEFQRSGRLEIGGGERQGAMVINEGSLTIGEAGLAALVGTDVRNSGAIIARRGSVALASGTRTTIDLSGDGLIQIAVSGDAPGGRVEHTGSIDASGGQVLLSAGGAAGALDSVINTSGVIRAGSASGQGGRITLEGRGGGEVRVSGRLESTGSTGGDIAVTGARVTLTGSARIDAGGSVDGGKVRLTARERGTPPLRRSAHLEIRDGAIVGARGDSGAGGSIIAWSDGDTIVNGALSAGGGAAGGFIETSGAFRLATGSSARIRPGDGGTWLLDPRDIVIDRNGAAPGDGIATPPAGDGPWIVDRNSLASTLNSGADVTLATYQAREDDTGNITLKKTLTWTGDGDLTLLAEGSIFLDKNLTTTDGNFVAAAGDDIMVRGRLTSKRAADITLSAIGTAAADGTANIHVDNDIRVKGSGQLTLQARDDIRVTSRTSGSLRLTTNSGNMVLNAALGSILLRRENPAAGGSNIQVRSDSGDAVLSAGDAIELTGGSTNGQWVRVGHKKSSSDLRLSAPRIDLAGGTRNGTYAEIASGPGGSITVDAGQLDIKSTAGGDTARITAYGGSDLTLRADSQTWNGPVRAGSGRNDGGNVILNGDITATVGPVFGLAPDKSFTFEGPAGGYNSALPLTVTTAATGTISLDAPVQVSRATLISEEQVRIGPSAGVSGTSAGNAVVIAAGRSFRNEAGPGAVSVSDPAARWLVYLDSFDGLHGTAPGPRGFDLYNRPFASNPPASVTHTGNRMIYGEQPVLTLTAGSPGKSYGTVAEPGFAVAGLRPGDSLATALETAPVATSAGSPAAAPVGSYLSQVAATASDQGYALALATGTVTVTPAILTVTADDESRLYGAENPDFTAGFDGFVLGQTPEDLTGALTLSTAATASSPVGEWAITPGGLSSSNYDIAFTDGTLDITPAPLSITADDSSRLYGAENPDFTASFSGLVAGDTEAALDGDLTFTTAAGESSPVGPWAVSPGGLSSGNYNIAFSDGRLDITPAPLSITADDKSRLYGADNPDFTASFTGLVAGDTETALDGDLTFTTAAGESSPVGPWTVSPSGLSSGNYDIVFSDGRLDITPAPLTVTADDASRSTGEANPGFTASYDGLVAGDRAGDLDGALSFATAATPSSSAGRYDVTPGGQSSGNYTISWIDGTLTVVPANPGIPGGPGDRPGGGDGSGAGGGNGPAALGLQRRRRFGRGLPPHTPGDASFRTTQYDAPPALANTFLLSYSLGEIIRLSPANGGFTPASGEGVEEREAGTEGFAPAAGEIDGEADTSAGDPTCSGVLNRGGPAEDCARQPEQETFWKTQSGGFR